MKLEFQIGTKSTLAVDLQCSTCKEEIHVHEHELIPECTKCGIHTHWKLK